MNREMERRAEPRYLVRVPVQLTVLGNPDREIECEWVEMSATGMKLLALERLRVDAIVGLEVEGRFVAAVIRNSQPAGNEYALGAERILVVDKDDLRPGESKAGRIRVLLEEQGWLIEPEPAAKEINVPARPWRVPIALAAGLVACLAMGALLGVRLLQFRTSAVAGNSPPVVAAPAPPAPNPSRQVRIKVLSPTWIAATTDGKELLGRLFTEGDATEVEFTKVAHVRLGAAGGAEITFQGKPLGPLGRPGQLRLIEFTPEGFRFLPWTDRD